LGTRHTGLAAILALVMLIAAIPSLVQPVGAAEQTHMSISAPPAVHLGDEWTATSFLTDSTGNPLGGLPVTWYLDGQAQGKTATLSDGSSLFGVGGWQPPLGDNTVSVSFNGTAGYLPSNATAVIDVLPANPSTTIATVTTSTFNGPTVELSPSNGSTVCPTYFRGNASGGVWDQSTLTCTLAGGGNVYPAFCVSVASGGCAQSVIGRLVIDKNVSVVINNGGNMAIYSEVDNYGTLVADIVSYGLVVNYGTIDFNGTDQLLNLPYNGLGVISNMQGATINNWRYITNAGTIFNYGTINNYGQFITQECSPCITGTLVNDGTYVGSAPAPVFTSTVDLAGGNGTADQNSTAGVTVTITGATGNNVTVSTQVQGPRAPLGIGSVQLSSTAYYDILISGTKTGIATVCIMSKSLNSSRGEIEYWNGTGWNGAADQTVSGNSPLFTYCGDIPVSALVGTPLAVGAASSTSGSTTVTGKTTETGASTSTVTPIATTPGEHATSGTSVAAAPAQSFSVSSVETSLVLAAVALVVLAFVVSRRRRRE